MAPEYEDAMDVNTKGQRRHHGEDMPMDSKDVAIKTNNVTDESSRKAPSHNIVERCRELLEDVKNGTTAEGVAKLCACFKEVKSFLLSQISNDIIRQQLLILLESSMKWRIPKDPMAVSPMQFVYILDTEDRLRRMRAVSLIVDLLFKQPERARYFKKVLPKAEPFFAIQHIENDEFHHMAIKVICQTLKCCADLTGVTLNDLEGFTRNVFDQIIELLQRTDAYESRASLMMCITLLAGSGHNKHILAEIVMGDLLIRLNESWKHETMVSISIISVFVDGLEQIDDRDLLTVADNCLKLHHIYSGTDDYHLRERLIALLAVLTKKLEKAFDNIHEVDQNTYHNIATVMFHKAAYEIQSYNMPKHVWHDEEFISFARTSLPALITILSGCINIITPQNNPTGSMQSASPISCQDTRRYDNKSDGFRTPTGGTPRIKHDKTYGFSSESDYNRPSSRRNLTSLEIMELCKCICCIFDAGATAATVIGGADVSTRYDKLMQVDEFKSILRTIISSFTSTLRETELKQWVKLIVPIVFVIGTRNRFTLELLDCFFREHAKHFTPHMLIFVLQILKNQHAALEYLKNVVTYSEGLVGLFSLNRWYSCAKRLSGDVPEMLINNAHDMSIVIAKSYMTVPKSLLACHNELQHLVTAVSKLCVTKRDPHVKVAITIFKHINKLREYAETMTVIRPSTDIILGKVTKAGETVHRDWLELMMAMAARGPFTVEMVRKCVQPAMCILRDFKWDLVPAALDMVYIWTDFQSPEEAYELLSNVNLYRYSTVEPQFIQCLSQYLQDPSLPGFRQNADVVMAIFSRMGSLAMKYIRNLPVKNDIEHAIAVPVQMDACDVNLDDSSNPREKRISNGYARSSSSSNNADSKDTDVGESPGRSDPTASEIDNVFGLGIPVIDGLNSVIRQMSKRKVSFVEFDASAVFVLNAVSPLLNFSVSLSECALTLASLNAEKKGEGSTKYFTQETTSEFIHVLMHALVKVAAVGMSDFPRSETYRDVKQLMQTIQTYIVIVHKTHANTDMEVAVDPVILLQGIAARLAVTRPSLAYNFGFAWDNVDPMEVTVASDFLLAVFAQAMNMQCTGLCSAIVSMLCLGCNSHEKTEKAGACIALGKICQQHPDFVKPNIHDIANSVAQICIRITEYEGIMGETLKALLEVDEPGIIQWAVSLLEHPLWYLRATGQICLKVAKNKSEVQKHLQRLMSNASNIHMPDVQLFLATLGNGDAALLEHAVSNIQQYLQSIAGCDDSTESFRDQAYALVDMLGQLLINEEYSKMAPDMEHIFNMVLVWFIKLVMIGGSQIAQKAKGILDSSKNVSVTAKTLSMALEEYIFQLQTIFDDRLLEKILAVLKQYRAVLDDALTESLLNVAKALVENMLNSSINDEYQNANFLEYLVFIANIGARRSCTDLIFKQWFIRVDCIRKGVIIPGSVAYGIWQVISSEGVIHNIFNTSMKTECLGLCYFIHNKADMDHILYNVIGFLESNDVVSSLLSMSLIHWLCVKNLDQITNLKNFKRLADLICRLTFEDTVLIDALLAPPFSISNEKILKWKLACISAEVLIKVTPPSSTLEKLETRNFYKDGNGIKVNRIIANAFLEIYSSDKCGSTLNPILGGSAFNMRNYQLRHLVPMLNKSISTMDDAVLDDLVRFFWESSIECDVLGKLLSVSCLSKIVEHKNTPPIGAAAVLERFVDVITADETVVFLKMHHTVKLDTADPEKKGNYTLVKLLGECADILMKALCGVYTVPETVHSADDEPKVELWKWIVLNKIKALGREPGRLIPLFSLFIWHLQSCGNELDDILLRVLAALHSDVATQCCNMAQSGAFDAFFGAVAIVERKGIDVDLSWIKEACIDVMAAYVDSETFDSANVASYIPVVAQVFSRNPSFELFSCKLNHYFTIPMDFSICRGFNHTHLRNNVSYCIRRPDRVDAKKTFVASFKVIARAKELKADTITRWQSAVATVMLRIVDQTLDLVTPGSEDVQQITQLLDIMWHMDGLSLSRVMRSVLYKLCCLFKPQLIRAPTSSSNDSQSTTVLSDSLEAKALPRTAKSTECQAKVVDVRLCPLAQSYAHPFPRWLVNKVITELQGVANDGQDATRIFDEVQPVLAPRVPVKGSPRNPASLTLDDWASEVKRLSASQYRIGFSNAVRSVLTLLCAVDSYISSSHHLRTTVLSESIQALYRMVNRIVSVDHLGTTQMITCPTLIPRVFGVISKDERYSEDERVNMEQLLTLATWSIAILGQDTRNQLYDVLYHITQSLDQISGSKLLDIATEMMEYEDRNTLDVDLSSKESGVSDSTAIESHTKVENSLQQQLVDEARAKRSNDIVSQDIATPVKRVNREDSHNACISHAVPDDIGMKAIPKVQFCKLEPCSDVSSVMIDYTSWSRRDTNVCPKELTESSDSREVGTIFEDFCSMEPKNLYTIVAYKTLLDRVKAVYASSCDKYTLDLELVYAIRSVAHINSISDAYFRLMFKCLDRANNSGSHVRTRMIAYIATLPMKDRKLSDIFEEIVTPRDMYSILRYIFSSEISKNKDREFYIPLFLDIIFTRSLDSWGLSFSHHYPVLPALVPKNNHREVSQIDLICQDDIKHTFKNTILLLRDFRAMAKESNKVNTPMVEESISIYVAPELLESANVMLQKLYRYYTEYFERIAVASRFKTCICNMWHHDRLFASQIWSSILPQLYSTLTKFQQEELGSAICGYLCLDGHLWNRGLMCKPVLQAVIKCYPPINIPPEVLKYITIILGAWDEVLYHLEKQLMSQPLDITRMATVLSDIYESLGMNDMAIGAYRTWVITQETRLAISFLQHAKWKQAQKEFNSIMDSLALTGQTAEAVSSFDESKLWYNGWVHASKQLGEWDLLRDVSFVAGDRHLFVQSSCALQDWGEVLPDDGLNHVSRICALDDCESKIVRIYQQLQTDLLPFKERGSEMSSIFLINATAKAEKMLRTGKDAIVQSWTVLPKGLSEAHHTPMRLHQRYVEVEEGMKYLTNIMQNIETGHLPQSSTIIRKWRQRMPSERDIPSVWHDMLSWRTFLYSTIRTALTNSHYLTKDDKVGAILNLQDLQWTLTKFASVTRKHHHNPILASVLLNKAQGYHKSIIDHSNVVTEDCLMIMVERIKQYLSIPINILDMLKGVVNIDLELVPSVGCEPLKSQVVRLVAEAISRRAGYDIAKRIPIPENELATNLMLESLKLEPLYAKNWQSWAKYNDKRIDHAAAQMCKPGDNAFQAELYESAIIGYLTAVSIRPHDHWLLIGRVLTLINEMKQAGQTTCVETIKKYSERVPASVWLLWQTQLISSLCKHGEGEMQHILQLLMSKLPQQVFYALRSEYFVQNSIGDVEGAPEATQPSTIRRILSRLIASNPNVGTMLESFATTVAHLGRPDFVDEVLLATETVFEECLDLPFNENIPAQMFNCLAIKMPHRPGGSDYGISESAFVAMMKEFERDFVNGASGMNCGETMNLLMKWMVKLSEISKMSHTDLLKQRMDNMKVNQFCKNLQMMNMELQLPTLQPTRSLIKPKQRHCLGESRNVVSLMHYVSKRKRGRQTVKSISLLAQNGQVYLYTVQPLSLIRQKSEQHLTQMLKLLNHYALKYNDTVKRNVTLSSVNLVSLDPYLCLYEEDVHNEIMSQVMSQAVSYENLVKERPNRNGFACMHPSMYQQTNTLLLVLHKMLMETGVTHQLVQRWQKFNPECTDNPGFIRVYQLFKDKQYPWFGTWYKKIHQDVLMEAYSEICSLIPDDILFNYALKRFDGYQDFMTMRRMFTSSYSIQALLGLMFLTPYATPSKLSFNFHNGQVNQLDFKPNYSREIFVEYSKLRVFRFTRNIKTMIGPVCRMGIMPAVIYALCAAIHTHKVDILSALSVILADDQGLMQSATSSPHYKPEQAQANSQCSSNGSVPSTPGMPPNRDVNILEEYLGRVLNYCSYLRSPTDQEQYTMPINNIITCIIDASADSGTLGKLKTSYQPWF
uniref:FAT domain-containing protein n=1 Tax=Babesia bovis TaxID=5865 RepID=A7AP42_BABBO|eukprot:XP_001611894.1 hypothetical protein [Babesia bovis T2Bo]